MPQEVKIKHICDALNDIQGWIEGIRHAVGSLDPELVIQITPGAVVGTVGDRTPGPVPQLPTPGVCYPPDWSGTGDGS